jgi:hypothetical protein
MAMRFLIAAVAVLFLVAAAPIQSVISCGRTGEAGGLGAGTDMERYTIDTSRFPEAVCNDGTPAVFYFAAGTDPDKWLIFLQGGGACRDGQSCAERWCSAGTNFGMDKMTSSLSKPSIRIDGLLDPGAHNRFSSWNRVLIFYCSSDGWAGTQTTTLQASSDRGATVTYDIHFKGSRIIDAVLDTLRNDRGGKRRAATSVGSPTPWPDLDLATHVMFAGSSAGGGGATHNGDRVGNKLRAANPSLADYRVLIDAVYEPLYENSDFAGSVLCEDDPVGCSYETYFGHHWSESFVGVAGARGDESCVAFHVPTSTEWRCADSGHVLMHHITSPWFLRQDLQDQLISGNFTEAGFGTKIDYGRRVAEELRALPTAEEAREAVPGLFVPQCTHHESVTNRQPVFSVSVDGFTFHDVVWNWWSAAQPQQVLRPFTGSSGAAPECP